MILHIWFKPHATKPEDAATGRFHIVEVSSETFDDACALIASGDLIKGYPLQSHFTGNGVRTISRRDEFAFHGGAVDRVQPSPWSFSEWVQE